MCEMRVKVIVLIVAVVVLFSGCVQEQGSDNDEQINQKPIITANTQLEKVVLNGLTLSGIEEQRYVDKELIIRGNIDILGNSKLELINSRLLSIRNTTNNIGLLYRNMEL